MSGRAGSVTARTLVARSRRPARSAVAATALRLAGGTVLARSQGGPALAATLATASAPGPAPEAIVPPPAPQEPAARATAPPTAPAPAGQPLRYPEAVEQAPGSPSAGSPAPTPSTGPAVPAAQLAPARATAPAPPGSLPAWVPQAGSPADSGEPPRHGALRTLAPQAPALSPQVKGRAWREGPAVATRATGANPLLERARRPAHSVKSPESSAAGLAAPRQPEPVMAEPPAAERSPAPPGPRTGPPVAPAHPPVTIGEIHVHVAEPPSPAADPLALLAPYARGLTARRDGAW